MNSKIFFCALLVGWGVVSPSWAAESMFNDKTYQALVADQKAVKVGDALTVLIQESSAASSSVDSKAARSTDLGISGQVIGKPQHGLSGNINSSGDGGGQTVRSGRVTAQITTTVQGIDGNGELLIQGQQTVDLNGEAQVISVSGRVRPRDISDGNSVLSSRIADARITYTGEGYIAEKSKPSLLSRFFNLIGL
ncbi:MAG: flagellar basal body L-ring protein FlgH [Rubrivivax sp.]|nr:MAG: flagellar basal body L-ring protein FlgH [Rubrivivax sp.]